MQLEIRLDLEKHIIRASGFSHDQSDKHFSFLLKFDNSITVQSITKASLERKLMSLCGRYRIATSKYMVP